MGNWFEMCGIEDWTDLDKEFPSSPVVLTIDEAKDEDRSFPLISAVKFNDDGMYLIWVDNSVSLIEWSTYKDNRYYLADFCNMHTPNWFDAAQSLLASAGLTPNAMGAAFAMTEDCLSKSLMEENPTDRKGVQV